MPKVSVDAPEELHWGISYLREDIQDIKLDIRALDGKIERSFNTLDGKIEELRKEVKADIGGLRKEVKADNNDLRNDIIDLHKEMTSNLKWTLGTIIAMSGLIIAFIKFVS